jgi:hypothetical protein
MNVRYTPLFCDVLPVPDDDQVLAESLKRGLSRGHYRRSLR